MKRIFFALALTSTLASSAFAKDDHTTKKVGQKAAETASSPAPRHRETAAEVAEKTRVSIRKAGLKVGHAVDNFLKKPAKKDAAPKALEPK